MGNSMQVLKAKSNAKKIDKIEIENLFSYLKQESVSPTGVIDKSKALTNVLIKGNVFNYLINEGIKNKSKGGINLGSDSIEGYTFTSISTHSKREKHYSIYARRYNSIHSKLTHKVGVVTGFLLRKEITKKGVHNILEARFALMGGKECSVKYDYFSKN